MMAHRSRAPVILTRYTSKPEQLGYFMSEMENIRKDTDHPPTSTVEEDDSDNSSEHDEEDATWLKKAGFENIVNLLEDTGGNEEVLESTELTAGLPKAHAAMIRHRMHTLRSTIRSRHVQDRAGQHSDVRNLFQITKTVVGSNDDGGSNAVKLLSIEQRGSLLYDDDKTPPPSISPTAEPDSPEPLSPPIRRPMTPPLKSPQLNILTPPPPLSSHQTALTPPLTRPSHLAPAPKLVPRNSLPNITMPSPNQRRLVKSNGSSKSPSPDITNNASTPTRDMKLCFCLSSLSQVSESLPSISLDIDPLGVTMLDDLSTRDMEKIKCLAHIELSITFYENNIPMRTLRSPKAKNYEEKQFGVPLDVVLQSDQKRNPKTSLPLLFKEMIMYLEKSGLKEEGILRVSGSKQRIKDLQDEIESTFNSASFSFEGRKPADVSSLLKQYLRELPTPLLTREHLPAFASISDISDLKEQVRTLNLLVLMLPPLHQRALKYLLEFCEKIHQEKDHNKMDVTNIAMVLAPNLFCSLPAGKLGCDDITLAAKTSHVVLLLIRYHYILWAVPSGMLHQVRFLYEVELKKINERYVRQAIRKMNTEVIATSHKKHGENSKNIIKVKAPLFTCVSKYVNIQENPTAGTVMAKLRKRSQLNMDIIRRYSMASMGDVCDEPSIAQEDMLMSEGVEVGEHFLYEVGGNIGERRLDVNTNMLALYDVNPGAEWIFKPRNYPHDLQ